MFFKLAQSNLRVVDPAGHGGDLSVYLSANNRLLATNSLEAARERAARANQAEINGDHKESIRLWGIIFGSDFPSYG